MEYYPSRDDWEPITEPDPDAGESSDPEVNPDIDLEAVKVMKDAPLKISEELASLGFYARSVSPPKNWLVESRSLFKSAKSLCAKIDLKSSSTPSTFYSTYQNTR